MNNYDTVPKQTLFIVVAGVGLLYLYTNLMPNGLPTWMNPNPPAPPSAQGSGYPNKENVPVYQPSTQSNQGQAPASSQQSNFGK